MKYIIGIVIGLLLAGLAYRKYKTPSKPSTVIPNTLQGFYAAVQSGQITFKLTDPMGIYDANGVKIGYYTADGSVYDINNNLIAKGLGISSATLSK